MAFKWSTEEYSVKNGEMDEEHAGLFAGIDKLDAERSLAAYEELVGKVLTHFADEEKLGLSDAHVDMHKGLVEIATAKMGELKGGAAVDDALVKLLQDWLMNHIKTTDMQTYGK